MTTPIIKIKVTPKSVLKGKMDVRFPANVATSNFVTVTRANGTYTFSVDYTLLGPGPISDPTAAFIAILDQTAGVYKEVSLASLLTSGLDADLQAIAALTGTGILARTADGTWALRTITGTANEITVTNGTGVAGAPIISLPTALTFTGKTITGGTYTGVVSINGNFWTAGTGTLTLGAGKTATISNTLTFTGTDASSVAFGAGGTVVYTSNNLSVFAATTSAQLRSVLSDETGTGLAYFQGGDLGTPSAGVLSSATGLPISTGVSGLATGVATFLATPSSANLRAALTDEVGTGAAYFVGGALGTPASGTLTNATGLPLSGLTAQGAYTIVANATGGSAVPTAMDITALTSKASPVSADIILIQDSAASNAFKKTTIGAISSAGSVASLNGQTGALAFYQTPQIRLTLTVGTPVTTADVTGATNLWLEPYNGSQLTIYDGSNWIPLAVAGSTYFLPATQSQSGTTHTNTTIDGLADTSQLVVGMQVTGTNVAANTTIATIASAVSITVNNATTGSATNTMTFKLPPNTNYDVWGINNSGAPKMLWSAAWTSDKVRSEAIALQDGVEVKSGATTRRLLGTVRTTSIAGQLEDSVLRRLVSNRYNTVGRTIKVIDSTDTWTYSTGAYRQGNGNTANQADIVFCLPAPISISLRLMYSNSTATARNGWPGIGIDSTTVSSHTLSMGMSTVGTNVSQLHAEYVGTPGLGKCSIVWLEFGAGSDTQTWYGDAGAPSVAQSGMIGWVSN